MGGISLLTVSESMLKSSVLHLWLTLLIESGLLAKQNIFVKMSAFLLFKTIDFESPGIIVTLHSSTKFVNRVSREGEGGEGFIILFEAD